MTTFVSLAGQTVALSSVSQVVFDGIAPNTLRFTKSGTTLTVTSGSLSATFTSANSVGDFLAIAKFSNSGSLATGQETASGVGIASANFTGTNGEFFNVTAPLSTSESVDLSNGDDIFIASGGSDQHGVSGGSGNDVIVLDRATMSAVSVDGGAGDDVIIAGTGAGGISLAGGIGNDYYLIASAASVNDVSGANTIVGGAGVIDATLGAGADVIYGGTTNDSIAAGDGANYVDAGSGPNHDLLP
jgi:Ca2+-binding RTX toxin-like protein